jgi:hypothetical protein
VKGLPQHGFPYAIATTELRPDAASPGTTVRVLRLDPKALRPAATAGTTEGTPTVVSLFASPGSERAPLALWWQDEVFLVASSAGDHATRIAGGVPVAAARPGLVRVVAGVEDLDGMLDWVELDGGAPLQAVDQLLAQLGCSHRVAFEGVALSLVGGSTTLGGAVVSPPALPFARFVRGATPSAHSYFGATPIVGPSVWQPLQSKRVRYFPKPAQPALAPASSASAAPDGGSPAPPSAAAPRSSAPSPAPSPAEHSTRP